MGKTLEEMGMITFLETLVGKRFDFNELKSCLEVNCKGYIVELFKKYMTDYDNYLDYILIGSLQNKEKDILCDFDIYYLRTRDNKMYITEVGYEFQ